MTKGKASLESNLGDIETKVKDNGFRFQLLTTAHLSCFGIGHIGGTEEHVHFCRRYIIHAQESYQLIVIRLQLLLRLSCEVQYEFNALIR